MIQIYNSYNALHVFTLRFSLATERFDDNSVVGFLVDKEVLFVHDHFFETGDVPYLTLVVCYRAVPPLALATTIQVQAGDNLIKDSSSKGENSTVFL